MEDSFLSLQNQFSDAVFDDEALGGFLKELATVCGAQFSELLITDSGNSLLQTSHWGPFDDDVGEKEAEYHAHNPRIKALPRYQIGCAMRDKDVITRDEIRSDKAYQEFIIPAGAGYYCAVALENSSEFTTVLVLHRSIDDDPFTDADARMLEGAAKACFPTLKLARKIDNISCHKSIDILGSSVSAAIVDRNSKLLDRTESFEHILASQSICKSKQSRLVFKDPVANRKFHHCLHAARVGNGGTFGVRSIDGVTVNIVEVLPLPQGGIAGPLTGAAFVVIGQRSQDAPLLKELVQSEFGLTDAEFEISEMLVQGLAIGEIATKRAVTIGTVRNLLKGAMLKTGSHRQAELVACLSSYRH